jgi:hypothetical protein
VVEQHTQNLHEEFKNELEVTKHHLEAEYQEMEIQLAAVDG